MRLVLAIALAAIGASQAAAAPQLIALLPINDPVALTCADGTCTAELATYCLQEHRGAPEPGHAYRPQGGGAFGFALVDAAGAGIPLDVEPTIRAARTYVAVTIFIPDGVAAGATGLVVGDGVVLVPEPVAGDPNPQTPEEIADATMLARSLGQRLVVASPEVRVALDLGRAANALTAGADQDTLGADFPPDSSVVLDACRGMAAMGGADVLTCLRGRRDALVSDVNLRYWRALATGS